MRTMLRRHGRTVDRGQALVEFSLAIVIFLVLMMGIFDLGRGIYMYNGVAEAAREIARRTSVYPGITLGASTQTADVIAVQRALVPGMTTPTFACETVTGVPSTSVPCASGEFVKVTVGATYKPITPLLGFLGDIPVQASSASQIP